MIPSTKQLFAYNRNSEREKVDISYPDVLFWLILIDLTNIDLT